MPKIAFILNGFALQTPGQQLLDRFLAGYPRSGAFHRPEKMVIELCQQVRTDHAEIARRQKDFGLRETTALATALKNAEGIVVAGHDAVDQTPLLSEIVGQADAGAACFVYGTLAADLSTAQRLVRLASDRGIFLVSGTVVPSAVRLPPLHLPEGIPIQEALLVVQGKFPTAELDGLDGLFPLIERRRGGESGIKKIRFIEGGQLWKSGGAREWPVDLLAAAVSRSDTPQGDPVRDGRTQDLVGLGLAPKLALDPRGWLLEHRDGLRSAILILDGLVADYNFALRTGERQVVSAQLYRPPAPGQHHFSRLAAVLEEFFRSRQTPWDVRRNLLTAGLLDRFGQASSRSGRWVPAGELGFAY